MKSRNRLLFVDNSLDSFYAYRMPLARAAQWAGFEVHVAAPSGKCKEILLRNGMTVHEVFMTRSGMNPPEELRCVASLYRLYRRVRPDLIHHLRLKPVLYGGLAAYASRMPAQVSMPTGLGHVFTASTRKAALLRNITLLGCKLAFRHRNLHIIFQNPDDRQVFVESGAVDGSVCSLIRGSGVDISEFSATPEPEGVPVVVLASRMLFDKGVIEFVQAARLLKTAGIAGRFVLVGDTDAGNPTAIPSSQLAAWNQEGVIEWWGHRADMRSVLAAANIVCLPSYREGVPKVLIEAAASSRAIVTTDVPGCREIVQDGRNGILVPPQNVNKLADALSFLLTNPMVRQRMAKRGRQFAVANFSIDRVVMDTISIYRELLERRQPVASLNSAQSDGTAGGVRPNETQRSLRLKRPLDAVVALTGMMLLIPVYVAIALLIRLTCPGPIFYGGWRIGRHGVPFRMWKFRTMVVNAEHLGGSATAGDDSRITPVGRFLRAYKLDELPQLLNVLTGEMSLVGPRPEVAKYIKMLQPEERQILDVKPGITDWASIWNANEAEVLRGSPDPEEAYEQLIRPTKIALQLRYVRQQSLVNDLKILFHTALRLVNPSWTPKELASLSPVVAYKDLVKI